MRTDRPVVLLSLASMLAGCDSIGEEDAPALLDWILASEVQVAFDDVTFHYEPQTHPIPTAAQVAEASEQRVVDIMGSCVVTQRDETVVTYQFDGCDGPRGLHGLNGEVQAVYEEAGEGKYPNMLLTGQDVRVNGATLDMELKWTQSETLARFSGSSSRGEAIEGDLRSVFGEPFSYDESTFCLSFSVIGSYQYDEHTWDAFVDSDDGSSDVFRRCHDRCPVWGSFRTGRAADADQLVLRFDGSQTAKLSDHEGDSMEPLHLDCTPCQTHGTDADNNPICIE